MDLFKRAMPFFNNIIPFGLALKGLEKLDPKLRSFISGAALAGYPANATLDYLKEKFQDSDKADEMSVLEHEKLSGTARPDEKAAAEILKQQQTIPNALQGAATLASGGLGGAAALGNLGLGAFQQSPQSQQPNQQAPQQQQLTNQQKQIPFDDIKQLTHQQEPQSQTKAALPQREEQANVSDRLGKYFKDFPDLVNFLQKQIDKGMSPREAATDARSHRLHANVIKHIEQDLNKPFEDLMDYVFGVSTSGQESKSVTQQATSQPTEAKQALMQAIQAIKARRGK